MQKNFLVALSILLFQGCLGFGPIVGPDYSPPELRMQDAWYQKITEGLTEGKANLQTWWKVFNDPVLNRLIDRADRGNLELKEAFARIKEARALKRIARGERVPDFDSIGDAVRERSAHTLSPSTTQRARTDEFFQLGGDASWEVDFWGRITRLIESAGASLEASIENYRDVLVVLNAEVATNYIEVRTLQDRIRFIQGNIETQRKTLQLTKDRFDVGLAPDLDVQQAKLNLSRTESSLPTLRMLLVQAINRLGVLLGEHPSSLHGELTQVASIPKPSDQVTVGLPVELLRQRPDIRQAERELAAQTALIGEATADLYPTFSLLGTFALAATDASNVFDYNRSRTHSLGTSFRWNIFDGWRVRNRIRVEEARTEQAMARYEQTILTALEDVENAMVSYLQEDVRRKKLKQSVIAARESVVLVTILYKNGLTDFENVQVSEQSKFEQEDQLAESEGKVIQNLISIYRALGGGWNPEHAQHAKAK